MKKENWIYVLIIMVAILACVGVFFVPNPSLERSEGIESDLDQIYEELGDESFSCDDFSFTGEILTARCTAGNIYHGREYSNVQVEYLKPIRVKITQGDNIGEEIDMYFFDEIWYFADLGVFLRGRDLHLYARKIREVFWSEQGDREVIP